MESVATNNDVFSEIIKINNLLKKIYFFFFIVILLFEINNKLLFVDFYRCEKALMASVNVKNCVKFYTTADEIGAQTLKEHCSSLISAHWVIVFSIQICFIKIVDMLLYQCILYSLIYKNVCSFVQLSFL